MLKLCRMLHYVGCYHVDAWLDSWKCICVDVKLMIWLMFILPFVLACTARQGIAGAVPWV
jgi:hypothetical protein